MAILSVAISVLVYSFNYQLQLYYHKHCVRTLFMREIISSIVVL